jgi:hypothetical protein
MLFWDSLKTQLPPSEIDLYAKRIGLSRISRNEEILSELSVLRQMDSQIQTNLSNEIAKKNPPVLNSATRTAAIHRAVKFLDSLREKGHFVDPTNQDDAKVLKYLKFTRTPRPLTGERPTTVCGVSGSHSARTANDIEEIQKLIDEEFERIQVEVQELRTELFSTCERLEEVKEMETPTTGCIEGFNKRLKTQEFVCKSMAKGQGSAGSRLRESVRMSRLWE